MRIILIPFLKIRIAVVNIAVFIIVLKWPIIRFIILFPKELHILASNRLLWSAGRYNAPRGSPLQPLLHGRCYRYGPSYLWRSTRFRGWYSGNRFPGSKGRLRIPHVDIESRVRRATETIHQGKFWLLFFQNEPRRIFSLANSWEQ